MEAIKQLLQKESVRLILMLLLGITVGVIFYPSKRIEEKLTMRFQQEISSLKETHSKEISTLTDKYDSSIKESKEIRIQSESKISKLTSELRDLKSKQKTSYYKLIKPDGTIEIKKFSESEVTESTKVITEIQEEFKLKIDQIESKWSEIHKERVAKLQKDFNSKESEYKKQIESLEKSKVTTTNEKHFGIELGILTNKDYFGSATMDVWGPFFLGVQGQISKEKNDGLLGVGLGMKF